MEQLRTYLNSLSVSDQIKYARNCGTTIGYLRKAISKKSNFDGALCRLLDEHSGGVVKRSSLRPDIWPHPTDDSPENLRVDTDTPNQTKAEA